ncbi:unnamed protein product [Brassica oleracea]
MRFLASWNRSIVVVASTVTVGVMVETWLCGFFLSGDYGEELAFKGISQRPPSVVRCVCESGAWYFLRGLTLRHGSDPARSDFNGGRFSSSHLCQRWQSGEVVRLSFPVR